MKLCFPLFILCAFGLMVRWHDPVGSKLILYNTFLKHSKDINVIFIAMEEKIILYYILVCIYSYNFILLDVLILVLLKFYSLGGIVPNIRVRPNWWMYANVRIWYTTFVLIFFAFGLFLWYLWRTEVWAVRRSEKQNSSLVSICFLCISLLSAPCV